MTEEPKPIRRILAEGKTSPAACRPLHASFSSRRGSTGWTVLLCILLLLLCPTLILLLPAMALLLLPAFILAVLVLAFRSLKWLLLFLCTALFVCIVVLGVVPLFLVALPVIATVYWLCMLVGCLARDVHDFGTLIPSDPAADKIVWIILILFTWIVGALAYHLAFRRRALIARGRPV